MRTPASAPAGRSRTASVMEGLRVVGARNQPGPAREFSADPPTGPRPPPWRQADNTLFANRHRSSALIRAHVPIRTSPHDGVNAKKPLETGQRATKNANSGLLRARMERAKPRVPLRGGYGMMEPGAQLLSPRYIAGINGASSNSTFTVVEPGRASTVSLVIHRCSSRSRITTRSLPCGRSYSMVTRVFIGLLPLSPTTPVRIVLDPGLPRTAARLVGGTARTSTRSHAFVSRLN